MADKAAVEAAAFQRKKLLVFAGLLAVAGLLGWLHQVGEANSAACISCQQRLNHSPLDSLTLVGSLGNPDAGYVAYYRTIRDPQLLAKLARLSQPGPALQLSGTDHKLSTQAFNLYWYQCGRATCKLSVAQTQAGKPYTDCYAGYNFAAHPRLIPMLDSLLRTQSARRWYAR